MHEQKVAKCIKYLKTLICERMLLENQQLYSQLFHTIHPLKNHGDCDLVSEHPDILIQENIDQNAPKKFFRKN